ncbi:hypothetical protein ACFU44_00985 [Nocardia rhizosphaerihabitans]|uniref:hypothetical protein n=1 Tax=Nocardia rhizosphaerihabitans TaxID=1691570 RepID=UPI003671DB6C
MTTISHVRGCQPSTMVTFGAGLLARTSSFTGRVTTIGKAVDRTAMNWQGKGATAASARAVSESLSATRKTYGRFALGDPPCRT